MKMILRLILLTILAFSLSGCSFGCPEPQIKVITEYVYKSKPLPKLQLKPKAQEYKTLEVNFAGVNYFALTRPNAAIMASNWVSYQKWAELNYLILQELNINNQKEEQQ